MEVRDVCGHHTVICTHGDFVLSLCIVSNTSCTLLIFTDTLSLNHICVGIGPERCRGLPEVTQDFRLLVPPLTQAQAVRSRLLLPVAECLSPERSSDSHLPGQVLFQVAGNLRYLTC